jgi:hypothetical protein
MRVPQYKQSDMCNETWARIVSFVESDVDPGLYEEAQIQWISALCTSVRDLSLCAIQIDALARRHMQTSCAPRTVKTVLVICSKMIEELDVAGSHRKSIEWYVLPHTTATVTVTESLCFDHNKSQAGSLLTKVVQSSEGHCHVV